MTERRGVRALLAAAGLAVTAACIYLAVRGVELDDAIDALRRAICCGWSRRSRSSRWRSCCARVRWWSLFAVDERPPLRAVTYALLVGYFFNNILPARAGEAARVIALHKRAQTPRAETIGTVVVERVFDILALLIDPVRVVPVAAGDLVAARGRDLRGDRRRGLCVLVVVIVRYDERAVHWLLSPLRRVKRAGFAERVEQAAVNATRGLVALRDPRDRDSRRCC